MSNNNTLISRNQSKIVSEAQLIIPLPTKQNNPISIAWYIALVKIKYQYLMFVMPAIRHSDSSGMPGKTKRMGKIIFDFWVIFASISLKSCALTSFFAIFLPNLPMKNKNVFDKSVEKRIKKKAVFISNSTIAKTMRLEFRMGTKHKNVKRSDVIIT